MNATLEMQRRELQELAERKETSFAELCRRFGVSAKTGHKWRKRWREGGEEALKDRSRRPKTHPAKCEAQVEEKVVALRREHPAWGGRKLRRRLQDMGETAVPAASTCTQIVRRHGLPMREGSKHTAWERFGRAEANELWQMDFKGHFPTLDGRRCHPLTLLDDHSRYNVALEACADEQGRTVREHLACAFRRHGLPAAILCDNGAPWGDDSAPYTALGVWLLRLGVNVLHGRPYHPQTQGKDERFHRALKTELIDRRGWSNLAECAERFPRFRHTTTSARTTPWAAPRRPLVIARAPGPCPTSRFPWSIRRPTRSSASATPECSPSKARPGRSGAPSPDSGRCSSVPCASAASTSPRPPPPSTNSDPSTPAKTPDQKTT